MTGRRVVFTYRHRINLPFHLFVFGQSSLQTLLGVQLWVPTLVDISEKGSNNVLLTMLQARTANGGLYTNNSDVQDNYKDNVRREETVM